MPQRHYFTRFQKDMKQWAQKYIDYIHFTTNLTSEMQDGFQFPSEYVGQYGCYEAIKHIYKHTPNLEHLL